MQCTIMPMFYIRAETSLFDIYINAVNYYIMGYQIPKLAIIFLLKKGQNSTYDSDIFYCFHHFLGPAQGSVTLGYVFNMLCIPSLWLWGVQLYYLSNPIICHLSSFLNINRARFWKLKTLWKTCKMNDKIS